MNRAATLLVLALAAAAPAQTLHTVGAGGDFATPQAAVDAAAPGDVVLLLQSFTTNVVIDKGLVLAGTGHTLMKPASGPGKLEPALRITGVPAGQSVLVTGISALSFSSGGEAVVLVEDCAGPVWIQDMFVDAYGIQALLARNAQSLVLSDAALQTNLVAALPDGTPLSGPGAELSGGTRAWFHGGHMFGSHGTLQLPGEPVPSAAADGGTGLLVEDAQARVFGAQISGGGSGSLSSGGCFFAGDGGDGVVTLDAPGGDAPAVLLRQCTVLGGAPGFPTCGSPSLPGAAFDVVPGSLTISGATPRRLDVTSLVEPGQSVGLGFDGAPGDVVLLFGAAAPAAGASVGSLDLHLAAGSLFQIGIFALPGVALDLSAPAPALPAGFETLVVPLQAFFLDAQGGKHPSEPRAVVLH